jgi:hypothetical protein
VGRRELEGARAEDGEGEQSLENPQCNVREFLEREAARAALMREHHANTALSSRWLAQRAVGN